MHRRWKHGKPINSPSARLLSQSAWLFLALVSAALSGGSIASASQRMRPHLWITTAPSGAGLKLSGEAIVRALSFSLKTFVAACWRFVKETTSHNRTGMQKWHCVKENTLKPYVRPSLTETSRPSRKSFQKTSLPREDSWQWSKPESEHFIHDISGLCGGSWLRRARRAGRFRAGGWPAPSSSINFGGAA